MDGLIQRAKDILLSPKKACEVIKTEETTTTEIIRNYLLYLAAIPVICSFIGKAIIGSPFAGRLPFFRGIIWLALSYVLFFVSVFISAFAINMLAPSFGAVKNELAAFKLVAYSSTAPLIAGVFYLFPTLSALSIFGLYGVYLLYLGLPILMECPQDKAIPYTIASILAVIGVYIVFFAIVGLLICRSLP